MSVNEHNLGPISQIRVEPCQRGSKNYQEEYLMEQRNMGPEHTIFKTSFKSTFDQAYLIQDSLLFFCKAYFHYFFCYIKKSTFKCQHPQVLKNRTIKRKFQVLFLITSPKRSSSYLQSTFYNQLEVTNMQFYYN